MLCNKLASGFNSLWNDFEHEGTFFSLFENNLFCVSINTPGALLLPEADGLEVCHIADWSASWDNVVEESDTYFHFNHKSLTSFNTMLECLTISWVSFTQGSQVFRNLSFGL
jgi:hypothetical protein